MTTDPDKTLRSHIRVDGVYPLPDERWADYTDRALAWIEDHPLFDPGETPDTLKRVVIASSCYAGLVSLLLGAAVLWPV